MYIPWTKRSIDSFPWVNNINNKELIQCEIQPGHVCLSSETMSHSTHNSGLHSPFGSRVVQRMCSQFNSFTNDKAAVWPCCVVYISKERKMNLLIISELQNINLFYKGNPRSEILNYEEYAWIPPLKKVRKYATQMNPSCSLIKHNQAGLRSLRMEDRLMHSMWTHICTHTYTTSIPVTAGKYQGLYIEAKSCKIYSSCPYRLSRRFLQTYSAHTLISTPGVWSIST